MSIAALGRWRLLLMTVPMLLVLGLVALLPAPAHAVGTGGLSGTVSDVNGPVEGITVTPYLYVDGSGFVQAGNPGTSAADGQWTITGLDAGSYYVEYDDPANAHELWWSSGDAPPAAPGDAGVYAVADGSTAAVDPAELPLVSAGSTVIHGTVQDGAGNLLDDINVEAYPVDAPAGSAPVASSLTYGGAYDLYLDTAGDYRLTFTDLGNQWADYELPGPVTAVDGQVVTVDPVTMQPVVADATVDGSVLGPDGAVADATVTLYRFRGTQGAADFDTVYVGDVLTDVTGHYHFDNVVSGRRYSVRASAAGLKARWLGDASSQYTADSFVAEATNSLAAITLPARPASSLGKVAGQDLAFCKANTLDPGDDNSSQAIDIPFELKFFGDSYTQLWVNNNGNITFDDANGTFTPDDLTAPGRSPMIAPMFADVDTSGTDGGVVTYGASPDGTQFCVNWTDVGYFSEHNDLTDTAQLILTKDSTGAGRVAGDFDITFNYDQVEWETGDASDGSGGFGGTSVAAGFTAGSGAPGTFAQLTGSLVNGALVDGGPNALVAGSQSSTQKGRYVFEVRNDGMVGQQLGGLDVHVKAASDDSALAGQTVQACNSIGTRCVYGDTNASGDASFAAIPAGAWHVEVWPADASYFANSADVTVTADQVASATIALAAPTPLPGGASVGQNGDFTSTGVPTVFYGDPMVLRVATGETVADPTYTVTFSDGYAVSGALHAITSPVVGYEATIDPFMPHHGEATITTNIPKPGGGTVGFDLYIDPSGTVVDQYGRALGDATVTLLRSETEGGPYTAVPDGDTVMSPSNRTNPDTTDAQGRFAWDVTAAWYEVEATRTGCTPETTPAMEVPPARLDLVVKLTCSASAPTPTRATQLAGSPSVGSTLTAVPSQWGSGIVVSGRQWLRDGAPIAGATGASYVVQAADVGHRISVTETARHPQWVAENGSGPTVTFAPVTSTSSAVTVQAIGSSTSARMVKARVKHTKRAKVVVTVTAPGTIPTGTVLVKVDGRTRATVALTVVRRGTVTVTLPRIRKKGKHKVVVVFGGSPTVRPSTSATVRLRIT